MRLSFVLQAVAIPSVRNFPVIGTSEANGLVRSRPCERVRPMAMQARSVMLRILYMTVGGIACAATLSAEERAQLSYNRDVRPILSNHCFLCHGRDEGRREAGLRLDLPEAAHAELDSGMRAIVPRKPEERELIARITTDDPWLKMPPPDSHKDLSAEQIETLRRWIAQGAPYQRHWSLIPPKRPEVPASPTGYRVANSIDSGHTVMRSIDNVSPPPDCRKRSGPTGGRSFVGSRST